MGRRFATPVMEGKHLEHCWARLGQWARFDICCAKDAPTLLVVLRIAILLQINSTIDCSLLFLLLLLLLLL